MLDTLVSSAKTAEPIEMPSQVLIHVGQRLRPDHSPEKALLKEVKCLCTLSSGVPIGWL